MLYNNRIVDQIAYSKEGKPPKDGWKKYFVVFFFRWERTFYTTEPIFSLNI